MSAFGSQLENVNLSLTAIGMLWTLSDNFTDGEARYTLYTTLYTSYTNALLDTRCAQNTAVAKL
jgi:hypothetical protein